MGLMDNKYMMIGAAAAGVAVVYLAYKGAGKVAGAVGDAAQAINPLNNNNIINQGFVSFYQALTGSTGTPGGDFFDATHGGALDVASDEFVVKKTAGDFAKMNVWAAGQAVELLDPRNIAKEIEEWLK